MGANQNLAFSSIYGGYQPVRYGIRHINTKQARLKSAIENSSGTTISDVASGSISINKRMQRTDVLTYLTKNEYSAFALDPTYPIHNESKKDHIASVSIQGQDGTKYYYEQPVYNSYKEEVVFACGSTEINSLPVYDINLNSSNHSGLIHYPNSYNDIDNTKE
jgi:hypothetical protein